MTEDGFAALLRELKERSGLSYGALGKRLHMSASTLHRYVSGEVVPVEFAPVERLARACRATPEELLELHRRWIRADALRGVRKAGAAASGAGGAGGATGGTAASGTADSGRAPSGTAAGSAGAAERPATERADRPAADRTAAGPAATEPAASGPAASGAAASGTAREDAPPGAESEPAPGTAHETPAGTGSEAPEGTAHETPSGTGSEAPAGTAHETPASAGSQVPAGAGSEASAGARSEAPADAAPAAVASAPRPPHGAPAPDETDAPDITPDAPHPRRPRSPRAAAYAAGGVVAVAAAVALMAALMPDGNGPDGSGEVVGASVPTTVSASRTPSGPAAPSRSATGSPSAQASRSGSPSATAGGHGGKAPAAPAAPGGRGGAGAAPSRAAEGPLLTVTTTPYYWEVPCDHAFLVDRSPKNVLPPPPQQDSVGWATAYGAVSANRQTVALTVQGTGEETVVLNDLHVRVVKSGPPLDWKQYVMGNGCGGGVDTQAFDVSLDMGDPMALPVAGQRDFPYKVSASDPEVFHVRAHTSAHDVSWYLELEWSSGGRRGTLRVDDHGKPFRTSASRTPSYYAYPLGGDGWEWVPSL